MRSKFLYSFFVLMIFILSACGRGQPAAPTVDVVAAQETAIANAWLAMTQTQAAIPTATATATLMPISTPTPLPTFVIMPTLPILQPVQPGAQPTAVLAAPTTNPCYNPPPAKTKGATVLVKFINKSGGGAALSFGMENANPQGECATYAFTLGKFDQPVVRVLAACYWAYAYIDLPSTARSPQSLCVFDTTKTVDIWITKDLVNFH